MPLPFMVLLIVYGLGLLVSLFHEHLIHIYILVHLRFPLTSTLKGWHISKVGIIMLSVLLLLFMSFYKCHQGNWNIYTLPHK